MASVPQRVNELPAIHGNLKPLQCQTFTCTLRTDQNSQISERQVESLQMCEILDA